MIGQAAALAMLMLLPVALGAHVECTTDPSPAVQVGDVYVAQEVLQCLPASCVSAIWIYEESNGIEALQRFDDRADDTCGDHVAPDRLVLSVWQPVPAG